MRNEILLYADLLIFLVGTLLYVFLARELHFRPQVLPSNRWLRWALLCLAVFYTGTLFDQHLFLLLGQLQLSAWGTAVDILRAVAWLLVFPLMAGTMGHQLALLKGPTPGLRALRLLVWLPLLAFLLPLVDFANRGRPELAAAMESVYPWIVLHAGIGLAVTSWLADHLARVLAERWQLAAFLRALKWLLAAMLVFFGLSAGVDLWSNELTTLERLMRSAVLAALLLPGILFAFFVRRYHFLRLSLSFRTLRHFLTVLILVLVVMAAGPALGGANIEVYREIVAWGMLLALAAGALLPAVGRWCLGRWPFLRQLLGQTVSARQLEALMDDLQRTDSPEEMMNDTADVVSGWLRCDARFLDRGDADAGEAGKTGETRALWRYLEQHTNSRIDRAAPPNRDVASALARGRLHAVFPLRVDGQLTAILGLSVDQSAPWGAGFGDGELDAVALVVRQLSAVLTSRQYADRRIRQERQLADQERLSLLGLIAASLAHEIKNPLSSMKILAQALRRDLATGQPSALSDGVADLDVIVEQIDRLDLTAREILGVARPRLGETCDLRSLLQSAVYILRAEAKRHGLELTCRIPGSCIVAGSEASWQTLIFNLLHNAVQHTVGTTASAQNTSAQNTSAKNTVDVMLTTSEPRIFRVTNPATGLDSADLERLFEPFVSEQGTGLGLSLAARRAQELGCHIDARVADGRAIFTVTLPPATRPDDHA